MGESQKQVVLTVLADTAAPADEGDECFNVKLSSPSGVGATLGVARNAVVLISDDETAGVVSFDSAVYAVGESGGLATITLSRPTRSRKATRC